MINMEALFSPSGPTPVKQDTVNVIIQPDLMVDDYAKAVVREAERKAPLKFQMEPLTDEEMVRYCRGILELRVESVTGQSIDWRRMKLLVIPDFIQTVISMVGTVDIRQSGIKLVPMMEHDYDMSDLLDISRKLSLYKEEISMEDDAFPRSSEGNLDVMSSALINGYVRALKQVTHPADTYVAAFLGFKLAEEAMFQVMYRVNYDDIDYITSAFQSKVGDLI